MIRIVRVDVLAVHPRRVRTVVAVRAGWIKLSHDRGKEVVGVLRSPGPAVQPFLPMPVGMPPEVFVAAVVQHQGRMGHQPDHVLAGLCFDLLPERRLLRVRRARQQEVLPDQQSALIACLIEVFALEDATAPDANQIDIRGHGLV